MNQIEIINELQKKYETDKESLDLQQLRLLYECEKEAKESIFEDYQDIGKKFFELQEKYEQVEEIVNEFYNNVDYSLRDMFNDLVELIGDEEDEN